MTTPTYYSDDTVGATFGYELDLWGKIRNEVAAGAANAGASAGDLEYARLSLIAQLAADYIQLRSLDRAGAILDQAVKDYDARCQSPRSATTRASPRGSTFRRRRRSSMPHAPRPSRPLPSAH